MLATASLALGFASHNVPQPSPDVPQPRDTIPTFLHGTWSGVAEYNGDIAVLPDDCSKMIIEDHEKGYFECYGQSANWVTVTEYQVVPCADEGGVLATLLATTGDADANGKFEVYCADYKFTKDTGLLASTKFTNATTFKTLPSPAVKSRYCLDLRDMPDPPTKDNNPFAIVTDALTRYKDTYKCSEGSTCGPAIC